MMELLADLQHRKSAIEEALWENSRSSHSIMVVAHSVLFSPLYIMMGTF